MCNSIPLSRHERNPSCSTKATYQTRIVYQAPVPFIMHIRRLQRRQTNERRIETHFFGDIVGQYRGTEWIRCCERSFVSTVRTVAEYQERSEKISTWLGSLAGDNVVLDALIDLKALMTGECRLSATGSYVVDYGCSKKRVFWQSLWITTE